MKNLMIIALFLASFTWSQDVTVLVNADNPLTEISKSDLKKIYFGKKSTWDSGEKVIPMHLKLDTDDGIKFTKLLKTDPNRFKAKWLKIVYSGKATPPQRFKTSLQVDEIIKLIPGGIGIVSGGYTPKNPNVKVIKVK